MAAVSAKCTAVYAEAGDEVKAMVQASKALVPKLAAGDKANVSVSAANQTRQVAISGNFVSGDTAALTAAIREILNDYTFPRGYSVETGGSYATMMESLGNLLITPAALLPVHFLLPVQFKSFLMPVMVMPILPVAFTGSLFGFPLTGRGLSMLSLVSIIMLAGTVVNSSHAIKLDGVVNESVI